MSGEERGVRRVVVVDENEKSKAIADGATPDVRIDPARPGFKSARMWVSGSTPVQLRGLRESLHLPHTLEPPPNGSVCRVVTFPPDDTFIRKVGQKEVQAYFDSMGLPEASTYSPGAPHPYMQKTRTLDFCLGDRRRNHARPGYGGSEAGGRRHGGPARHQSRVEQSLRQAVHSSVLVAPCGLTA